MNRPVEWIKDIVRLCIKEFGTEEERKQGFAELEREYLQFTGEEKKQVGNIMMTQFEVNDILYVLFIVINYIKLEDFQGYLMENILRGEFDAYTGSMLQYQALCYVKGEYRKKRILNKRNIMNYERILGANYPYIPMEKRNRKRIVIVTGQLLGIVHSPTRVIMNMAYVLQRHLGYQLLFFVCPCNSNQVPLENQWHYQQVEKIDEDFENMPVRIMHQNEKFDGYQISMGIESLKEYHMMLSLIHAWNPFFVIDADTTNGVVGLIKNFTTLVSFPMSSECPISEADILVRTERKDDATEEEYAEMLGEHQTQLFMKEKFPVIVEESQSHYTRAELGLPEDKFLIAVVGNRLVADINQEFVQIMKRIIEKEPRAAFVIIGESDRISGFFEEQVFEEHIYFLGYCADLSGVYQTLDLYLNPKRVGGGFSGGMALLAGLPVVTLPGNDVAYNCGEQFVVQDYEVMIDTVLRYTNDQEFYGQKKECARRYKEENGDTRLIRYMEELVEGVIRIIGEQES